MIVINRGGTIEMRRLIRIIGLAAAMLALTVQFTGACNYPGGTRAEGGESGGEAAAQNEFRWSGQVASGRTVEIKGVNGDVRAEASSGGEVEVVATKSARRSDP